MRSGTSSFFNRGASYGGDSDAMKVTTQGEKDKLKEYDVHIKKFEYKAALDSALKVAQHTYTHDTTNTHTMNVLMMNTRINDSRP